MNEIHSDQAACLVAVRPDDRSNDKAVFIVPISFPDSASEISGWTVCRTRLPQVTREQVRLSALLAPWPEEFCAELIASTTRVLALYAQENPEDVSLRPIELCEIARPVPVEGDVSRVYAWLELGPYAASAAVELSAEFGISLSDIILGGDGRPAGAPRAASPGELALIEFLCLRSVQKITAGLSQLGEPLISLQRVHVEPPPWLSPHPDRSSRWLLATLHVGIKGVSGLVRVWANAGDVSALFKKRRHSAQRLAENVDRYARITPDLPLSVSIGEAEITVGDLVRLECDDILIVRHAAADLHNGVLGGLLRVRVGEGEESFIIGQTEPGAKIKLRVQAVSGGKSPTPKEGSKMKESTQTEDALAVAPPASQIPEGLPEMLDGLLLTVHVEIAARRIRLDEMAQLRVGYLMDLECQITDPVALLVHGRRIAEGELVEFEGQLGVRITRVGG